MMILLQVQIVFLFWVGAFLGVLGWVFLVVVFGAFFAGVFLNFGCVGGVVVRSMVERSCE